MRKQKIVYTGAGLLLSSKLLAVEPIAIHENVNAENSRSVLVDGDSLKPSSAEPFQTNENSDTNTGALAALITALAAVGGTVATIVNAREKARNRHAGIFSKFEERVYNSAIKIIALTHPLLYIKNKPTNLENHEKELLSACSELELLIAHSQVEIVDTMRKLVKLFLKDRIMDASENVIKNNEISSLHAELTRQITALDYTYLKHIVNVSHGDKIDKNTFYEQSLKRIKYPKEEWLTK